MHGKNARGGLAAVESRGLQCFVQSAASEDVPEEMYCLDVRQRLARGPL